VAACALVYCGKMFDVIVVGGGASGLMAAGRAAELGKRVLLLEKNRALGEKLKITGGGRCNVTNAEGDQRILLKHYGKAEKFLYSAFAQFGVENTFTFFEKRGLPLVIQAGKRAFPHTEKAADVYTVLEKYLREGKVTVQTGAPVTRIISQDGSVQGTKVITAVVAGGKEYTAQSFIFATGGVSHPETGSTGDGFNWLGELGHAVAKPTPTIVPLAVKESWVKKLAGVSLDSMKITFFVDGKKEFSKSGKILFTHFGLSGPLILNSAHQVGDLLHNGTVTASIDLFPKIDLGTLERTLIALFDANKNKILKNVFKEAVPAGMSQSILSIIEKEIDSDTKVHSVTKEERKQLVTLLKALPITIIGLMGYDRAVISDGGIPLEEVDMKTMQSRKVENLWVTGDLLHVNRPSGGYSLQLCWTTGYIAGSSV
jgi:predicted Rossmann fold flavoprotein